MERRGHLIEMATETEDWEPLQFSHKGPYISHLFFVDDLILFCRVDVNGADCVKKVFLYILSLFWLFC